MTKTPLDWAIEFVEDLQLKEKNAWPTPNYYELPFYTEQRQSFNRAEHEKSLSQLFGDPDASSSLNTAVVSKYEDPDWIYVISDIASNVESVSGELGSFVSGKRIFLALLVPAM